MMVRNEIANLRGMDKVVSDPVYEQVQYVTMYIG
jgi:hypothetical protein